MSRKRSPPPAMTVMSYGGGTNSTAMLIALHERGEIPDVVLFADTGGERPRTYRTVATMDRWSRLRGGPGIDTVQLVNRAQEPVTLEGLCLKAKMLPSIAYGRKACSQKHKRDPQDKRMNADPRARAVWESGGKVLKLIGYDADEPQRFNIREDPKYTFRAPLIEWDMGRDECIELIDSHGIERPGKSACFFCPNASSAEVRELAATHPDLASRAIAMERNARLHTIAGLGRRYRWEDLVATPDMFGWGEQSSPCGCYDGEPD